MIRAYEPGFYSLKESLIYLVSLDTLYCFLFSFTRCQDAAQFKHQTLRQQRLFLYSTLRGNAELGDNNQVEVALVIYL